MDASGQSVARQEDEVRPPIGIEHITKLRQVYVAVRLRTSGLGKAGVGSACRFATCWASGAASLRGRAAAAVGSVGRAPQRAKVPRSELWCPIRRVARSDVCCVPSGNRPLPDAKHHLVRVDLAAPPYLEQRARR
eukprot:scaffold15759_cov112-Isochrysis_galbana.AAC.4